MTRTLLPDLATLRSFVAQVLADRTEQGHITDGYAERLAATPDSYDALLAVAQELNVLPLRVDWPYVEPDDLGAIWTQADPDRDTAARRFNAQEVARRVETAWYARVCGCILGKPFEFDPTLDELRGVLEPAGEWPLTDYVTEETNARLRQPQPQWPELVRERIAYVCEDDDLNYTVLAMLLLERHGTAFTHDDVRRLWLLQLPVLATFGPERTQLLAAGMASLGDQGGSWAQVLNPTDEHCGALIRADAYGWACPGDPELAASLAHRDATVTHRRTGVYATMWVAAALACALVSDPADRLGPFRAALGFVPQQSRFAAIVRESLGLVEDASDWEAGYRAVHGRFGEYSHCRVYQEVGTLMNTARFARDVGHGLGLQVCQGNDTDSFGATAGSYLGALLGPEAFDRDHWTSRFGDRIHLALATFHEQSLSALAGRMSALPARIAAS
ncbi:MAG TPA: ADP-ribosylglycohydrolase family protein [Mycobacteriales bacterium]|nr:ADP-ribosylglycohydrolase family protein [Mycobacteriales bacterium]